MDFFSLVVALVSLVAGAVLGVALDRAFEWRVEAVPTVRIACSCSDSLTDQKFNLEVTNLGTKGLPPYHIVLFHPDGGSIDCFPKTEASERLPHQIEVFSFSVSKRSDNRETDGRKMVLALLTNSNRTKSPFTDEESKLWRLQLVLTHSDHFVLFEDSLAGIAVVEVVVGMIKSGSLQSVTGDQMWRARAHNSWTITSKSKMSAILTVVGSWRERFLNEQRIPRVMAAIRLWWRNAK